MIHILYLKPVKAKTKQIKTLKENPQTKFERFKNQTKDIIAFKKIPRAQKCHRFQ